MGELAKTNFDQLPVSQVGTSEVFDEISKGEDYLGRLQLYSSNKEVKKGLIKPGHFGIPESKEEVFDLTETIDLLILARRPKAVDFSDLEAIIETYDTTSEEFQRIAEESKVKDANCMYGVSLLVYERTTGRFLEFFCASKSARKGAKSLYGYMPLTAADVKARALKDEKPHGPIPVTLKSRYVEKGDYSWHVFDVSKCSTPFKDVPDIKVIGNEMTKFANPVTSSVEKVPEETAAKARAR